MGASPALEGETLERGMRAPSQKLRKGSFGFVKGQPALKAIREIHNRYLTKIQEFVLKDLDIIEVAGHNRGNKSVDGTLNPFHIV